MEAYRKLEEETSKPVPLYELLCYLNNPRMTTPQQKEQVRESLNDFGDLSGIIYNVQTRTFVCGEELFEKYSQDFDEYVKEYTNCRCGAGDIGVPIVEVLRVRFEKDGGQLNYREVDWDRDKHLRAMIVHFHQKGVDGITLAVMIKSCGAVGGLNNLAACDQGEIEDELRDCEFEHDNEYDDLPIPPISSDKPADIIFTLGHYRLLVTKDEYLLLQKNLHQAIGTNVNSIEHEIRKRIFLCCAQSSNT